MPVNTLFVKLALQSGQFQRGLKQSSQELNNFAKTATTMQGVLELAGIGGLVYFGKRAAEAVWDLGQLGAQTQQVRRSFEELARQSGSSADALLAAIQRATGGTVSEYDAMLAANRGMMLGLGANVEQWEQLVEVARFKARAMGIDVTQALNDITTGIGRESRMILDNLGIVLDLDEVMGQYADTVGKSAEELSAFERKQAIVNSVVQEGQQQIAAAGGIMDDNRDSMAQMEAAADNLKRALAERLAPGVALLADSLADLINVTMGVNQEFAKLDDSKLAQLAITVGGSAEAWEEARDSAAEAAAAFEKSEDAAQGWMVTIGSLPAKAGKAADAIDALAAATQAYHDYTYSAAGRAAEIYEYRREQLMPDHQSDLEKIIELNENMGATAEEEADRYDRAWQSAFDAQERALADLRSAVEAALSPTGVTAADMEATQLGEYVDKWDENARRLDAIAQRGFAELQAHPEWAKMLNIPPEVLTGTEQQLKTWAGNVADAVRDLSRPDLINVDAAADAVEEYMRQQAAKEITIDLVVAEIAARGGLTEEDARQQVLEAYGLAAEPLQVPITLTLAAEEGVVPLGGEGATLDPAMLGIDPELMAEAMSGTGRDAAQKLIAGFMAATEESNLAIKISDSLEKNAYDKRTELFEAGNTVWNYIANGIEDGIWGFNWASIITSSVQQSFNNYFEGGSDTEE